MSDDGSLRQFATGGLFCLRQAAKQIGSVALALGALTMVEVTGAATASPNMRPDVDIAPRSANLGMTAAISPAAASFTSRFHGSQPSFITDLLAVSAHRVLPTERDLMPADEPVIGIASTYNPNDPTDRDAGSGRTSSGELYDAESWTAAIRTDLRWQFGGVRFGKNYRPTFALVESGERRVVVRINDVGPLKPGRIIDFNVQTMRYFDPTMQAGLIHDVKVTPLMGENLTPGPVAPTPTAMVGDFELYTSPPHFLGHFDNHSQLGPLLFLR